MNLDLDVLRSVLNANKLSVAYSQRKLPVGWAALLLRLQKGGAWRLVESEGGTVRRDGIRSAIGSAIEH